MRAAGLFAGSILVAFVVWQFLSTVVFNPFLIPPPLVVFKTMVPMVENGEIFKHVAISLARVAVGFTTGCVAGITLGVILGRIRLVNELLDPIIELLRYLSPTAMRNRRSVTNPSTQMVSKATKMRLVCSSTEDCCSRKPMPESAARISAGMMLMNEDAIATRMPVTM